MTRYVEPVIILPGLDVPRGGRATPEQPIRRLWANDEIAVLKQDCNRLDRRELARKLGRDLRSVQQKCYGLSLKMKTDPHHERWTDEEIATLRKNYGKKTVREIAKSLNRGIKSITNQAYNLGLSKRRR